MEVKLYFHKRGRKNLCYIHEIFSHKNIHIYINKWKGGHHQNCFSMNQLLINNMCAMMMAWILFPLVNTLTIYVYLSKVWREKKTYQTIIKFWSVLLGTFHQASTSFFLKKNVSAVVIPWLPHLLIWTLFT